MLRAVRRWFSTEEVKQLAEEIDRLIDRHSDYGHKLEGLSMRIERLSNKYRMRDARAARGGAQLSDEDRAILDDIRAQSGEEPPPGRDPFYS